MVSDAEGELDAVTGAIAADITAHAPYSPRGRDFVGRDVGRGYTVQDAVVARLTGEGARGAVAGYKVAANSAALMRTFGLQEPVSARLFADQLHESPAGIDIANWREPAFEPEIAAILGGDVPSDADAERAADAVRLLVPAFELLDMRGIDKPPSDIAEAVGQNITNEGVVVGGPGVAPRDLGDLDALTMRLTIDGAEATSVTGGAPQHPFDVVAWMAHHLAARGLVLRAGMVVLCGTHTPIQYPSRGARVIMEMTDLGRVETRL